MVYSRSLTSRGGTNLPLRFPRYARDPDIRGVSDKVLRKVVDKINTVYRKKIKDTEDVLTTLGDSVFSQPRGYVPSGILPIDCVVCYGMGFPTGIIEIYGGEASFKTGILENTLAEAQRSGYYTVIFPTEYSINYRRIKSVGVNEDQLLVGEVETIEDVYDQIKRIVKLIREDDADTPILIGWDSVAATPTRTELEAEGGLEASDMGRSALQMSKLFRRLVRFLFVNKVCLVCINQTRTDLGKMYGNKESTFGGRALKFYAWVRCRLSQVKSIKNSDNDEIGVMVEFFTIKNKWAPPRRKCRLPVYWDRGVDPVLAVWEYAVDKKVFTRKGTAYRYKGQIITRASFPRFYGRHRKEIDKQLRRATAT